MLGAGDVINCYKCRGNGMTVMVYQVRICRSRSSLTSQSKIVNLFNDKNFIWLLIYSIKFKSMIG